MKPVYSSHRDDQHGGGQAPTKAHMALQTGQVGDADGILAIPPGAHLFFISDPRRADGIMECILEKLVFDGVVLKEIRLVAYTRNTRSTRRLRLVANWEGKYESLTKDMVKDGQAHMDETDGKDEDNG